MVRFYDTDPERIERRLAEIAAVEASRRRVALGAVCGIVASFAVSLLIMSWGFSMDDLDLGPTIFFSGALVGNVGIVVTLVWAYRAGEE
jgi:hypothetical protein